jgi:hypothetical protein
MAGKVMWSVATIVAMTVTAKREGLRLMVILMPSNVAGQLML